MAARFHVQPIAHTGWLIEFPEALRRLQLPCRFGSRREDFPVLRSSHTPTLIDSIAISIAKDQIAYTNLWEPPNSCAPAFAEHTGPKFECDSGDTAKIRIWPV